MTVSAKLVRQKTPCSRVRAPRVAARPGRGGASGASFMPDSKTTGDRDASRPIDVEPCQSRAAEASAREQASRDKEGLSFFFRRTIRLDENERTCYEHCIAATMQRLKDLQTRLTEDLFRDFDLVSGLASYVAFLRQVCAGKEIRYSAILHVAGTLAAYMGHEPVLRTLEREGVALDELRWSPCVLSVLSAAIVGHRDALASRFLKRFPHLVDQPYWHDAVAICVKYGTVRMLRILHSGGVNLDRKYMTKRRKTKPSQPLGSPLYFAVACNRPDMQRELLRLGAVSSIGEGAPDTWLWGDGWNLFEVAVSKNNFAVADMCLEKGAGPVFDGEGDVYVLNRSGASKDMEKFAYFESRFGTKDFSRTVSDSLQHGGCKEWFSRDVLVHCGVEPDSPEPEWKEPAYTPECVPDDIAEFFHALKNWPELIVPWSRLKPRLVRLMFGARGLNIFPQYASSLVPVFRFAKIHQLELWGHCDQQEEFMRLLNWEERRHLAPHVAEFGFPELKLIKDWESDRHPSYLGDEWDERQWKAASAEGKEAERYLDDERFVLKDNVSLVGSFAGFLSEHADWPLFQKWIMRGMPPYRGWECDWDYPLIDHVNAGLLRHLVKDLGMLPDLKGRTGAWAMSHAIERHDLKLVRVLLELGVPVNAKANGRVSPLRKSILVGADDISSFLLASGGRNIDSNGRAFPVPPWVSSRGNTTRTPNPKNRQVGMKGT